MNAVKGTNSGLFLVLGAVALCLTLGLVVALDSPVFVEQLTNLHPALTSLYDIAGKWGVAGIGAVLTLLLLAGGIYRFLDEQALFATSPTLSSEQLNIALMQALEFGAEDLLENKNGRISPTQQQKLTTLYQSSWGMAGCSTLFGLLALGGIALFVIFSPDPGLRRVIQQLPALGVVYAGIFGVMLFVTINGFVQYVLRARNLPNQPVYVAEGKVKLSETYSRYGTICTIRIGWKNLYVTQQQLQGFWHGGRYRIYYLKYYSPILLSAEILP